MTVTDSFHSIHSAIIARSLYFDYAQNIPNGRREIADISDEYETTLEPPVVEWLAAQAYRLLGGEQVWAPRLLAESFWFIGGIFLYLIGKALAGRVAALLVTLPIMLLMVHYDVQAEQASVHFETRATAEEIGELTAHSSQVVYLARFYGRPVEYLGEFSGAYWPRAVDSSIYNTGSTRPLSIEERLRMLPFTPTHFVTSDFAEFQRNHSDLKSFLREECALVEENERYLIYSDCFS